ncbi:ABC transporter ATP-binding protein [Virgisporangium ochraceum]|uniref:ABC transporter ATP-binding protein n=1 Tax=Virgisporangium ochraceum TaxID=65505 RepID=A0A8J4A408_9ACTN|nr:ABC transporter ATP-binding protein [Virgisporangium ochraceum]GIJ75464.1 ABC transporter ATP-binding protein [Virgisporangium ochraceum]
MTEIVARAVDVSRRFGEVTALDSLSLDIPAGQLLGLLGPNGAGKTTLISLFVGLRRPSAGRVEICGGDPVDAATRRHFGVTPQQTGLPPTLRVSECVDLAAAHFSDPLPRGELLERFGLTDLARRQTGGLSGGQQRRLAVALAFVGRPRLVFLDEPTTGLDVDARHTLWEGIRLFHRDGGTVVLTSHYLEEVEELAERVVVMFRGRAIADGDLAEVRGAVNANHVSFVTTDPVPDLPGAISTARTGDRYVVRVSDPNGYVRDLVASGVDFTDLEVRGSSLEEAFLALTTEGGNR